jgi:hypothetical protein
MKSRTRKFRPDREWRGVLAIAVPFMFAAGCHTPALFGAMRQHPAELVGTWVDSVKTTDADTTLWILGASGDDAAQHVRRDTSDAGRFVVTAKRHYGYWFLEGAWSEPAHRTICFTNRPGRSAPSCAAFRLDSVPDGMTFRRRLVVYSYQGQHRITDRVLLERTP